MTDLQITLFVPLANFVDEVTGDVVLFIRLSGKVLKLLRIMSFCFKFEYVMSTRAEDRGKSKRVRALCVSARAVFHVRHARILEGSMSGAQCVHVFSNKQRPHKDHQIATACT